MAIIQVRRANVILDIPDVQKDEYLAKGFDVIDAQGRVVERTVPNDINALKKAYAELAEEVKKLKEENKQLKEKLAAKPEKVEKPKTVEVDFQDDTSPEDSPEPEEPRRRRKKQ